VKLPAIQKSRSIDAFLVQCIVVLDALNQRLCDKQTCLTIIRISNLSRIEYDNPFRMR
jgi:hypothetical protein